MTWLIHSAKGTTWKEHKYIRKEGKRYFYKLKKGASQVADVAKGVGKVASSIGKVVAPVAKYAGEKAYEKAKDMAADIKSDADAHGGFGPYASYQLNKTANAIDTAAGKIKREYNSLGYTPDDGEKFKEAVIEYGKKKIADYAKEKVTEAIDSSIDKLTDKIRR